MKTLFIGQNAIYVNSLASTNSYASELLSHLFIPDGSIIYTFNQEKGRGQRGNSWECEPNMNITLSLVLYPKFLNIKQQFLLTKMVSLAVADLMAEYLNKTEHSTNLFIKWPNDIYINNKKVAGILIENNVRENSIQSAIIGIGININQLLFKTPDAISLAFITKKQYDLMNCIERLCGYIEARYLQLKASANTNMDADYLHYLYQFNEWATYKDNKEIFEGKIIDVSATGKLQVQRKSEKISEFDFKEIAFL
ncbi:MAG: biotin--[acetyl-CoA-carboxylase] ligase [Bacteroidia bacterium]